MTAPTASPALLLVLAELREAGFVAAVVDVGSGARGVMCWLRGEGDGPMVVATDAKDPLYVNLALYPDAQAWNDAEEPRGAQADLYAPHAARYVLRWQRAFASPTPSSTESP